MVLEAQVRANEELGTTTLIITHNAMTAALADRVLIFADGRIERQDSNPQRLRPEDINW